MKKHFFVPFLVLSVLTFALNGCASKEENKDAAETAGTTPAEPATAAPATDGTVRYTLAFAPDSAVLGEKNEMLVKLTGGDAVELSDPDGRSTGIKLTVKFTMTNRNKIGSGSGLFLNMTEQRLLLDNGNAISVTGGDSDVTDQESSKDGELVFELPAGTKPQKLNLFEAGTRNAVTISLNK